MDSKRLDNKVKAAKFEALFERPEWEFFAEWVGEQEARLLNRAKHLVGTGEDEQIIKTIEQASWWGKLIPSAKTQQKDWERTGTNVP